MASNIVIKVNGKALDTPPREFGVTPREIYDALRRAGTEFLSHGDTITVEKVED